MSAIFWLDLAGYVIAAVLATSLALTVLSLGPKHNLNRLFALFTLTEAVSALSSFVLRMSLWLQIGDPDFWLELYSLGFCLMGPFLLAFTVRYVGQRTTKADWGVTLGLAGGLLLVIPLFRGQLIFNARLDSYELLAYDLSLWGAMVTVLPILYYTWALTLFWRERRRTQELYMALGMFTIVAGFVGGGILRPHFPVMSITTTASIAIIGYGVVSRQLLNPLRELTEELERKVAERTQALTATATKLKEANRNLARQTQELKRSNAELEQFAYIASHDLQEPLRKVKAFGERLQSRYAETLDARGLDYLARMQNAAERMQRLINALLSYSRVTTQARPFVALNLTQAVQEALSDLEVYNEQVGGQVQVGDMPTIEADPTQMRQLFQNLIGNALKFHRPGEPPLIQVHAQLLKGRGLCEIAIKDNGIGFDEKYLDRIFKVFQRLHGRDEYEGTGIGLATCRKIVERHGGEITARSTPGQGATFIVTLPARQSLTDYEKAQNNEQ